MLEEESPEVIAGSEGAAQAPNDPSNTVRYKHSDAPKPEDKLEREYRLRMPHAHTARAHAVHARGHSEQPFRLLRLYLPSLLCSRSSRF